MALSHKDAEVRHEKFRGARHLGLLYRQFATGKSKGFAADSLAGLDIHIQPDPNSHDLPPWLPFAQDINLLHAHLCSLRLKASDIDASDIDASLFVPALDSPAWLNHPCSIFYPPPFIGPYPSDPFTFSGLEWIHFFDKIACCLSTDQEGLHSDTNDNNQAWATRRGLDYSSSFERFLARGQRVDDLKEALFKPFFSRTLWSVTSVLEVGDFLGCLASDSSFEGFVTEDYVLRSELICILALLLRQLLSRSLRGQDNVYAEPLAATVITCTEENARVLQSYITLPESGPPQLHIVVRLNMAISKATGRDEQALKHWSTIVSWIRFGLKTCGSLSAQEVKDEKDKSVAPDAAYHDLASQAVSESLPSGSVDKDDIVMKLEL